MPLRRRSSLPTWAASPVEVVGAMGRRSGAHRITGLAAEVAFFGLLSLFPALVALVAVLGSLDALVGREVAADAERAVLDFLRRVLTDEADEVLEATGELFRETNPGVLTAGALGALWSASRGFAALIDALGVVYERDERRPWLRRRGLAVLMVLGSVVVGGVLLGAVVVGPLFGRGEDLAGQVGLGGAWAAAWDWLRWPVVVAVAVGWATTVFHFSPDHRSAWRHDLPGAFLTTVCWMASSVGLRAYLAVAGTGNEVLGVLGGTVVVVLWLYALGLSLLVGGELNAVLEARRRSAIASPSAPAPPG